MGGDIDGRRWRAPRLLLLVAPLALLACNADGDGPAAQAPDSATTPGGGTAGATRTVPTVPPSTVPGQVGTVDSGVIDGSPTIAPVPVDPNAPTTPAVPPTTDLVGDPQPAPNQTLPPPPPPSTAADDPDACERLAAFDVVAVIADTAGVTTVGVPDGREICRYASGSFVAEVHYISVAEVRDDWFQRPGIQPVGEVGGDAVGFDSFTPPGSPSGAGYTIAVEAGSRGAIVAVAGADNPRRVAAQVAIFAGQAGV